MDAATRPRSTFTTDDMVKIMSRIQRFTYRKCNIRVIDDGRERWIVFADVCKALGYKNPNHESKKVAASEKCKLEIGLKNTLAVCINSRGLLSFTLFADKSDAIAFWEWADNEVFSEEDCGKSNLSDEEVTMEIWRILKQLTIDKKMTVLSNLHYLTEREETP